MSMPFAITAGADEGSTSGIGPDVNTEYKTIPIVPNAMANKMYATIKAPFPKTRRPRESCGESSIPIMTESDPLPKGSPTAMRLQNSIVAHAKGKMPTRKIQTFAFRRKETAGSDSGATCNLVEEAIVLVVGNG